MKNEKVSKKVTDAVTKTVVEVDKVVDQAEKDFETKIAPVRDKAIRRFPALFLLTVTFGVTATFTGFEQILIKNDILQQHPWIILLIGIATLFLTGRLYRNLG